MDYLLLAGGAFLAGLVDAVVGGGGLIQLPLLMTVFPGAPVPLVFGTNKVVSIAGTASAAWQYGRKVKIDKKLILPILPAAFVGGVLGASIASRLTPAMLKPLVIVLLVSVGLYTFLKPDFGKLKTEPLVKKAFKKAGALTGGCIGFYDGFFGPGTGSFLIFAFVRLFGLDMLHASASAKIVNLTTNIAAIIVFSLNGGVMWKLALLMAAMNILGAQVGIALAVRHGNRFIRGLLLVMVSALTLKLTWEYIHSLL